MHDADTRFASLVWEQRVLGLARMHGWPQVYIACYSTERGAAGMHGEGRVGEDPRTRPVVWFELVLR